MQIANGARLIAAVPVYAGHDYPREWLIAAERADVNPGDNFHRYVVSTVDTLDAGHWHDGSWYNSEQAVMAAFYLRVPGGFEVFDREHLETLRGQS